MARWIHVWQDSPLSDNDTFAERLADEDRVTDDEQAWEEYQTALINCAAARMRVLDSLRQPTDEEREANRQRIREAHTRYEELDRASTYASEPCEAVVIDCRGNP